MSQASKWVNEHGRDKAKTKVVFVFRRGRQQALNAHKKTQEPDDILYGLNHFSSDRYDTQLVERDDTKPTFWDIVWYPIERMVAWQTGTGFSLPTIVRNIRVFRRADTIISIVDALGLPLLLVTHLGLLSTPVVYVSQGLSDRVSNRRVWRFFYRRLLGVAQQVVVLGEGAKDDMQNVFALSESRISVIPFGIDASYWQVNPDVDRQDFVLSVGNDAARDFETLCRAVQDRPLTIITRQELPPVCKSPNISIRTGLTNDELRQLYQRAAVAVTPLKDVAQPSGQTATMQAMACGTPVVITKTRGFWNPKVMQHEKNCLLVQPYNHKELRAAIERIFQDPLLAQQLATNARRTVEGHYTSKQLARHFEQVIKRVTVER